MCIIMRWSRNHSASWAERFWTTSLLCTYKLCDYYTPIPILSPFLFIPSLYVATLNLQDFSFICIHISCAQNYLTGTVVGLVITRKYWHHRKSSSVQYSLTSGEGLLMPQMWSMIFLLLFCFHSNCNLCHLHSDTSHTAPSDYNH